MWLVVLYWLSMSPASHMSKLIRLRFCRRPMRCIVQRRGAHRTETVNAERSKTRKHHRTDLITRLPPGWIHNRFFNNARSSVSRLNTSFTCRDQGRVCLKKWRRCGSLGLNISHTTLIRIHARKRQTPAKQAESLFGSALPWIINRLSFSQSQQLHLRVIVACVRLRARLSQSTHLSAVLKSRTVHYLEWNRCLYP